MELRSGNLSDLNELVRIENSIFKPEGIKPFTREHFSAWLETYPCGLHVVESHDSLVGYAYSQIINCNPEDRNELSHWTSFEKMTDNGYTRKTHKPNGNYHLGVSIGSLFRGAGKLLVQAAVDLSVETKKPLLGMSRISGLRSYTNSLRGLTKEIKPDILALIYTLECAKMVKGAVDLINSQIVNNLPHLPSPTIPDPVLCKYLKNPALSIWAILPNFLEDPASLNYSILIGPKRS